MGRILGKLLAPLDERFDVSNRVTTTLSARTVPAHARRFWYCFGGLAFFTAVVQALSGIFLAFYYQPTPENAYASVFYISNYVRYGWLIRSIHSWGGRLMVALVVIHMIRVFVTASYKHPRELNWIAGVLLFAVTMAFTVTGDLLSWDQQGYWSTSAALGFVRELPVAGKTIASLLLGGDKIGAPALTRFYVGHIMLLPAAMTMLLIAHFWMVRKQGISGPL